MKHLCLTFFICLIKSVGLSSLVIASEHGMAASHEIHPEQVETCSKIFQNSWLAYQELSHFLPRDFKVSPQIPTHQALRYQAGDCASHPTLQHLVEKAIGFHTQRIAFLLPLSLWPSSVAEAVQQHVTRTAERLGWDTQKNLIWIDTAGNPTQLQNALATLVFQSHVSLIIGGLTQAEAPVLAKWAKRLRIPSIILNRHIKFNRSPHLFSMAPDPESLAATLLQQMKKRSLHRIAVLISQSSREGALLEALQRQARLFNIQLSSPYLYNASEYSSIDFQLRNIFHIDDNNRIKEKFDLLKKLKLEAEQAGVPYEGKELVLPAIVDVDGILLIDHFKSVRHITKAISFYGVKNLPLLGIPKWRALELIEPPDEQLNGSQFVDYIGSYQRLPYGIQPQLLQGEFIVDGQDTGLIDLQILHTHALYAAMQTLRGDKVPRYSLYQRLEKARNQDHIFFYNNQIFRSDHTAYWPSFVFAIMENKINMVKVYNDSPTP